MNRFALLALALVASLPLFADEAADIAKFGVTVTTTGLVPVVVEGQALSNLDRDFSSDSTPIDVDLRSRFTFSGLRGAGYDLVQFRTSLGTINAELLADGTDDGTEDLDPHISVNNFKTYLATDVTTSAGRLKTYDKTFIHRTANLGNASQPRRIVQGGGYRITKNQIDDIDHKEPIVREFHYANTRGTIAMARTDKPDSATSEWFFNLNDNTPIFNAGTPDTTTDDNTYAVFARVIGNGMSVVDRIGTLPTTSLGGAFGSLPLRNWSSGRPVQIANLVFLDAVRIVPLQPSDTGKGGSVLTYSVTNDNPSAATVTLSPAGRLVVTKGKRGGRAIITVRASEGGGAFAQSALTVTHPGPPVIVKQLPATTTAALGTSPTLTADITAWPLHIRWQRLPAGLANIPANWIDIAHDDVRFEGADTEYLKIKLTGANADAIGNAFDLNGEKLRYRIASTADAATPLFSNPTLLKITTTLAFSSKLAATTTAALGTGSITLSAPAAGGTYPAPSYQWERKAPNGEWAPILDRKAAVKGSGSDDNPEFPAIATPYTGTNTANLVIRLNGPETPAANSVEISTLDTLALHLSQYRCVISHDRGDGTLLVPGTPTTLRITTVPVGVATQPAKMFYGFLSRSPTDTTNKTTLSVAAKPAANNTPVKYQWQRLNSATGQWDNLVNHVAPQGENPGAPTPYLGVTGQTLTIRLPSASNLEPGFGLSLDGAQYRCVLTNVLKNAPAPFGPAAGQAISATSTLRIVSGIQHLATDNTFILPGTPPPSPSTGRAYSATGLPAGLTINSSGVVTGFITAKPGIYKVVLTVTEGTNRLSTTYYLVVEPLGGGTVGAFEALLSPADEPHYAKLALQIAGTGALTGTLTTTTETKPLPFKGAVVRDYDTGELSFKAPIVVPIPGLPAGRAYVLTDLLITTEGHLAVKLHTRANAGATPVEVASATYIPGTPATNTPPTGNFGRQLGVYSKKNYAPWHNVSSYNLAITAPTPLVPDPKNLPVPAGSGYANAPVSADGRLNFKGKLADGTKFTASLRGGTDASFRLFLRPYSAAPGGVLSAFLPMSYPSIFYQRNSVFGDAGKDAYWTKPKLPKSANFRDGFGPLGLSMRLEPWYPSYFRDFGFAEDPSNKGKTQLALSGVALGASAAELPESLGVTYTLPLAPFADFAANDASRFTGKLDTRSGFFQGTFRLTDAGVVRTVAFEGTLLMAYDLDIGTVTAEGFFLLPPPGGAAAEAKSGLIQFKSLYDDPNEPAEPEEDE